MMETHELKQQQNVPTCNANGAINFLQVLRQNIGAEAFDNAVKKVRSQYAPSRPCFPDNIVVGNTSSIDQPLESNTERKKMFREDRIDRWQLGKQQIRDFQFRRWSWCCENMETYVEMLRKWGHADESIFQMILKGRPLSVPNDALFTEFKQSLAELKGKLEKDTGWSDVSFVLSGSSVCGFSQNPVACGGDILTLNIQGRGVHQLMGELHECDSNLILALPATRTLYTEGLRYSFLQEGAISLVSDRLVSWYNIWSKKLSGFGVTFSEASLEIPPWEARVNVSPLPRKRVASEVIDNYDESHNVSSASTTTSKQH